MSASPAGTLVPQGPGSVAGAPNLPDGFADTFTSRYVDIGKLRLHAVTGGDGPPLLLIHGWPQTWYQWRLLMPALARDFRVVAVDQRGIGLSEKPSDGYDTATLANDMVALMDALGHPRFAVVGCDTGLLIGYALAADHPDRIERVALGEAPLPGVSPATALINPPPLNARLWHIPFNALPEVNEQLVRGREDIFFGSEFAASAGSNKLADDTVKHYVGTLAADPEALHATFHLYRQFHISGAQNEQRKARKLTMPVLAMGGGQSLGDQVGMFMRLAAEDVQTLVLPEAGHWIAEQAPDQMLAGLTAFLAPYRDAHAPARSAARGAQG